MCDPKTFLHFNILERYRNFNTNIIKKQTYMLAMEEKTNAENLFFSHDTYLPIVRMTKVLATIYEKCGLRLPLRL